MFMGLAWGPTLGNYSQFGCLAVRIVVRFSDQHLRCIGLLFFIDARRGLF